MIELAISTEFCCASGETEKASSLRIPRERKQSEINNTGNWTRNIVDSEKKSYYHKTNMTSSRKIIPCPLCKKKDSDPADGIWPFCTERCKLIDMGEWTAENYSILGKPESDEENPTSEET